MGAALFLFYRRIFVPLVTLILFILRPLVRGKLQVISEERGQNQWIYVKNPGANLKAPIWIHAASGEIEYARPLIREFKKRFPKIPIVVTYSSPSAKKILSKINEVDAWGPSPWDSITACQKFLDRVQPQAVYFARTDVWPEISYQLKLKKIPSTLFSATFAKNSSRLKGLTRFLTIWTLNQLTRVLVVSTDDQNNLKNYGFKTSLLNGDTRYDQVFYRLGHPQRVNDNSRPAADIKILVAGSTWPEDEKVLFSWFAQSRLNHSVKLLLAPHEISNDRLTKTKDFLKSKNIDSQLYSENKPWTAAVLIVDQIGILAELYTWGTAAFVGGSFRKQVHSVMEPLACGLPVCVGPFHQNNREALEFQNISWTSNKLSQNLVCCIRSAEDLETFWQANQSMTANDHKAIASTVNQRTGATQKIVQTFS